MSIEIYDLYTLIVGLILYCAGAITVHRVINGRGFWLFLEFIGAVCWPIGVPVLGLVARLAEWEES